MSIISLILVLLLLDSVWLACEVAPRGPRRPWRGLATPITTVTCGMSLFGTHLKGATCSSQVSKVILGPIQPKRLQGPSHPGNPEGLEGKGNPRAKGPESHATPPSGRSQL